MKISDSESIKPNFSKILPNLKHFKEWLTKNLSTCIESVVGNWCIHRPFQNPQDSLQVGSERDGERDLSTERTLIGWNWFFISSYIALLVAMNVFKYVQYIGITNGEIILWSNDFFYILFWTKEVFLNFWTVNKKYWFFSMLGNPIALTQHCRKMQI